MSRKKKYLIGAACLAAGLVLISVGAVWLTQADCRPPRFAWQTGSRVVALDEDIVLYLDNLTNTSVLVPLDWKGIAIYRQLPSGNWREYRNPGLYYQMINTSNKQISYRIPGGSLEPGIYLLSLQGMWGPDGEPFSLDAQVEVSEHRLLQVALAYEEHLVITIINNREHQVELDADQGIILERRTRDGWQQLEATLPEQLSRAVVLDPGEELKVPMPLPGQEGDLRLTVEGTDSQGNPVRGQARLTVPN